MPAPNQVEGMPSPPYFARLLDARATLGHALHYHRPDLRSDRYFVVVNHFLDDENVGPGLWLQVQLGTDNEPFSLPATACEFLQTFSPH